MLRLVWAFTLLHSLLARSKVEGHSAIRQLEHGPFLLAFRQLTDRLQLDFSWPDEISESWQRIQSTVYIIYCGFTPCNSHHLACLVSRS